MIDEKTNFTLLIDLSTSQQDPPEMVKVIMANVHLQPAFLLESDGVHQWPDTLEIRFPQMQTELGGPTSGRQEQELQRPGTAFRVDRNLYRSIFHDLDRKAIEIPTVFFTWGDSILCFVGGKIFKVAQRQDKNDEQPERITKRNTMLNLETPKIQIQKLDSTKTKYTTDDVRQATGGLSLRSVQNHIKNMKNNGDLPADFLSRQGKQLEISAKEFEAICSYIGRVQRGKKQ